MKDLSLLYNVVCLLLGGLIVFAIKPFIASYSGKKGENFATKEDIAQITKVQEEIKAEISDNIWDRQRQWELKRDVVFDVIRAMADLGETMQEFSCAFLAPPENLTDEAKHSLRSKKLEAIRNSLLRTSAYQRAHTVADLAIHGELSRSASAYFQCAAQLLKGIQKGTVQYDSKAQMELAKLHNMVVISARKELGIRETGDLPVLDYESLSSGANTGN